MASPTGELVPPEVPEFVARARASGVTLSTGGREVVGLLEPLWLSLFDNLVAVGSTGFPVIPREWSWPRRRRLYLALLAKPDAFALVAWREGRAVGYALAHVHEGADELWATGPRVGEVESLAVLPEERNRGLGALLLDAAEARLASIGVADVYIAVEEGNDGARRFYERRGMVPGFTTMVRLGPAAGPAGPAGSAGSAGRATGDPHSE